MNRYIIGSLWDRVNRNGANKNFEYLFEGRHKIDELNRKAEGILTEAKQTNDMNRNVQQQINTLIAESGTSDAEVLQARIDSEGKTHSVLKDRLDESENDLSATKKSLNLKSANAQIPLSIPTDNSEMDDHVVHPYVLDFPTKKYGYLFVMAFTPYSEGRDRFENPSIVVSDDRYNWRIPNGLKNPVIKQPATGYHYSDPMLIDNGIELEMWYRLTNKSNSQSKILLVKTTDLISWTTPVTMFDYSSNARISPSGHIEAGKYKIWSRNTGTASGNFELAESTDLTNWSTPKKVNYDFGEYSEKGYIPWHNEVKLIDGRYLSIVDTMPEPDSALFLFESQDGINFNLIKKVMEPSLNGFDSLRLYKASIVKFGLWTYIYYSAFAKDNSNHIGLTKALGHLEFTGMKYADKDYFDRKQVITNALKSEGNELTINSTLRMEDKSIQLVRRGVSESFLSASDKMDALTVRTVDTGKAGYMDVAGIYLDSDANDSIQGIRMDKGATYLDKNSKALSIHPDGTTKQNYARLLMFDVSLANNSINVLVGSEQVIGIENSVYGFVVNFKNMPTSAPLSSNISILNSEGIMRDSQKVGFNHIRSINFNGIIVGLKTEQGGVDVPLDSVTLGRLKITVTY